MRWAVKLKRVEVLGALSELGGGSVPDGAELVSAALGIDMSRGLPGLDEEQCDRILDFCSSAAEA